jgi:thiamine-monophosphate kinase
VPQQSKFRTEEEFLHWLTSLTQRRTAGVAVGIGDDAATVRPTRGQEIILTTDLTIEGVHFLPHLHPARAVGHRALARALSDVAAMGGRARFALISLAISRRSGRQWVKDFYAGARRLSARHGVALVGGDTAVVAGPTLVDVVIVGEAPRSKALRRSGARPGDRLYVSGRLGLSALGLELLRSRCLSLGGGCAQAVRAHLYPQPRLRLGEFLRAQRLASALMDISDGLSTDLQRLCRASGAGARLFAECIPGPSAELTRRLKSGALRRWALDGGEDYELLFSVRPQDVPKLPKRFQGLPLTPIGEVVRGRDLSLILSNGRRIPLVPGGYDHFREI